MQGKRSWWWMWLAVACLGCSPALNWREARLDGAPLQLLLPCKPDRASRDVDMAGRQHSLAMVGCDADGATFAVSHVLAADTDEARALLEGWKAAVLTHARATDLHAQPFALPGGWATPQTMRVQARGRATNGTALALDACWFARVDTAGVHLFHAVVLAPQPMPQASETFFGSLALR